MSNQERRVQHLEGERPTCPTCAWENIRIHIRWPGEPEPPPPDEVCPDCGRSLAAEAAAVAAIKWPEGR
jgi:hypothetical protein